MCLYVPWHHTAAVMTTPDHSPVVTFVNIRGETVRVRNRFWNRQMKRIGYPFRPISNRNSKNLVLLQVHAHIKSTQDFKCLTLRSPLFQRVLWSLSSSHLDSDVSFLLVKMFFLKNNCRERILSIWRKECMEPIPEPWETMLAFGYPNMKNMEPFHP